jgi:Glycosyltransferases involved in cell wall biogenesis
VCPDRVRDDSAPHELLVIIPAWNEEESVGDVVRSVRECVPQADVLVVSDGSRDGTVLAAREAGAEVLDLKINLGVGGAMRAGFVYAVDRGYRVAIQVDADGQHNPTHIPDLVDRVSAGADIVIGSRFEGIGQYRSRGPRRWAMKILASVLSGIAGTRLTDVTSGFKAYSARALKLFSTSYPAEYLGDTIEALVVGIRSGLRIEQVGVEMRRRVAGEPSHSPVKSTVYLLRAALALAVALVSPVEKVGQ